MSSDSELDGAFAEFLVFRRSQPSSQTGVENRTSTEEGVLSEVAGAIWTDGVTRSLLEEYKHLRNKVGHTIASNKKLYEILAGCVNNKCKVNLTPKQVEYKIANLLKRYKSLVDNNNKTGRGTKYFKFEAEMDEIFGASRKIHPEVLLSSTTEVLRAEPSQTIESATVDELDLTFTNDLEAPAAKKIKTANYALSSSPILLPSNHSSSTQMHTPLSSRPKSRKKCNPVTEILNVMREEKTAFYKEALEKIAKDADERKRNCDLQAERNNLLREYLDLLKGKEK